MSNSTTAVVRLSVILFPALFQVADAQNIELITLETVNSLSSEVAVVSETLNLNLDDSHYLRDDLNISGEVRNGTNYEIYSVRVTAFAKDLNGGILEDVHGLAIGETMIETSSGWVTESIRPGATGFFSFPMCCSWSGNTIRPGFDIGDIASYSMSISFRSEVTTLIGDINRDGSVDFDDFFLLSDNFGKSVPAIAAKPLASVSEEESYILLLQDQLNDRLH
jgi:hypothetical protein